MLAMTPLFMSSLITSTGDSPSRSARSLTVRVVGISTFCPGSTLATGLGVGGAAVLGAERFRVAGFLALVCLTMVLFLS
jgi:hypothetical protein